MTDASDPIRLISREQLLTGLPERRASTLLYAIENLTAQLVARSRRALLTHLTERSAAEQERAFLSALAGGRDGRAMPRVQDLERYADRWQELVPADPPLKAALARQLLGKYAVPPRARRIPAALGLAELEVVTAYERAYGEPPRQAFARRLTVRDRLRWLRSGLADRLERLPPFWTAYALTLTETVGGGILALPIALAGFGPLGAIGLLVAFGVINVLTVAALCEAIIRNGRMRYGSAYFGRLVLDFLGRPGLVVLSVMLTFLQALVLIIGLIGFGDVLGGATGLHPALWAGFLFLVTLVVLGRGSLDATVASAIVVGSVNLGVLAVIAVITLASAGVGPVLSPADGGPDAVGFEPASLALVFGVVLAGYFGHVSAGNAAKVVLRRDPGGRALLWGNVAAMGTVIVVYVVLISAIFAALDERTLIGHPGTVIAPLAEAVGPSIHVLGAIYATLALGIGSLYGALGLYNLAGEAIEPLSRRTGARLGALRRPLPRFLLRISPALVVFLLLQALLVSGQASFTGAISVIGTLGVPVLAGVFPMLMVVAARRRGDRMPAAVIGLLGRRPVVWSLWTLFVSAVLAHAVIWPTLLERLIAAAVGIAIVVATVVIVRRGALRPVASLEIRYDDGQQVPTFSAMAGGRPVAANVSELPPDGLSIELPPLGAPRLRIWAHRVAADETSVGLNLEARVSRGNGAAGEPLRLGPGGDATVPVPDEPVTLLFSRLPLRPGRA